MDNCVYLKSGVGAILQLLKKNMKLNIIALGFLISMKIGPKNMKIEM